MYDNSAAYAVAGTFLGAYMLVCLAVVVFMLVCLWKIYAKAGKPGWGAIVPFYNMYLLYDIAMGNGWLFLLTLVPLVNFVMGIVLMFKMAKAFGKGVGFGFGLLFLSFIFYPILAFGSAEYEGPQ